MAAVPTSPGAAGCPAAREREFFPPSPPRLTRTSYPRTGAGLPRDPKSLSLSLACRDGWVAVPRQGSASPPAPPLRSLARSPCAPPAPSSCRQLPSKLDGAFPGGNNAPDWGQRALPHGSGAGCHGGGCPARSQAILGKREEDPSSSGGWERPRASQHGRSLHQGFEDARPCSCSWHRAQSCHVLTLAHGVVSEGKVTPGAAVTPGHLALCCGAWWHRAELRRMGAWQEAPWVPTRGQGAGPTAAPWQGHGSGPFHPHAWPPPGGWAGAGIAAGCVGPGRGSHPTNPSPQLGDDIRRAPHARPRDPQHRGTGAGCPHGHPILCPTVASPPAVPHVPVASRPTTAAASHPGPQPPLALL